MGHTNHVTLRPALECVYAERLRVLEIQPPVLPCSCEIAPANR